MPTGLEVPAVGIALVGTYSSRCWFAHGEVCECPCGGGNHGAMMPSRNKLRAPSEGVELQTIMWESDCRPQPPAILVDAGHRPQLMSGSTKSLQMPFYEGFAPPEAPKGAGPHWPGWNGCPGATAWIPRAGLDPALRPGVFRTGPNPAADSGIMCNLHFHNAPHTFKLHPYYGNGQ